MKKTLCLILAAALIATSAAAAPPVTIVDKSTTYSVTVDSSGDLHIACDTGCSGSGGGGGVSATIVTGQATIATTGTAVQFRSTSTALSNGLKFCAFVSNVASITVGASSVTNVTDGTGNGAVLAPGQCGSIAINNVNLMYLNGTTGDGLSYGPDN